jgi:hypothetical protein
MFDACLVLPKPIWPTPAAAAEGKQADDYKRRAKPLHGFEFARRHERQVKFGTAILLPLLDIF